MRRCRFAISTAYLALACVPLACNKKSDEEGAAAEASPPSCSHMELGLASPMVFAAGSEDTGKPCPTPDDLVDDGHTDRVLGAPQRGNAGDAEVVVRAFGPSGSGRTWTVFVRSGKRGACLDTSTAGFRTLAGTTAAEALLPLEWVRDVDGDGSDEIVIWSSFAPRAEASLGEHGLSGRIYRLKDGALARDLELDGQLLSKLASTYREAADEGEDQGMKARRKRAAAALERATKERCREPGPPG